MLDTLREVVFQYLLPILIILVGLYMAAKTNLLKDISDLTPKPYSFARSQLFWWSLIIVCCFSISYGSTGTMPELSASCLILLGISLGTTTTARIIDNNEINSKIVRYQNELDKKGKGFLYNILSDENGVSIHRFQALVFNIIFGLMFIVEFASDNTTFINFSNVELSLMGISSAAYVGLKMNENK